jgi:hypothetical protein
MKPIKVIAQDDDVMLDDINTFMLASYAEQMEKKAQTPAARVADAIVAATEDPKWKDLVEQGSVGEYGTVQYIYYKHLAQIANDLMDEMNLSDNATDEDKKKRKGMTPNSIGAISRDELQFPTRRKGKGFVVVLLPERIKIMKVAWGLDLTPRTQEPVDAPPIVDEPEQDSLFDDPNEA